MTIAAVVDADAGGGLGRVLARARRAQSIWRDVPIAERCRRLRGAIDQLADQVDAVADLIVDATGKPRVEALGNEIAPTLVAGRHLCARAPQWLAPRRTGLAWMPIKIATIAYEPLGVVLVISPWNLPLSIPFGQVLAALVAGNAVVLKPSEVTPEVGNKIGDLFRACDVPSDLMTVVQGDGTVGARLIDAGPDKVIFTGSLATGRRVMRAAAEHPIPVCLELGGTDALIACDDADLELVTSAAAWGMAFNGGQVCASVERILVQRSVRSAFIGHLVRKLESIGPDDLGRTTLPRQRDVYLRHLEDATRRGMTVICGGNARDADHFEPTLIDADGHDDALVVREETFGPIATIVAFDDDDDAVVKHNARDPALTASVFSASRQRAHGIARRLNVGAVSINDVAATLHAFGELPWGGQGRAGFGRSHGRAGLYEMAQTRVIEEPRWGRLGFKRPWWFPYDPDQLRMMRQLTEAMAARGWPHRLGAMTRTVGAALRMLAHHPRT